MSLLDDGLSELQPLAPRDNSQNSLYKNSRYEASGIHSWSTLHTCIILFVRLLIDFAFKHPFLFYSNYTTALNITDFQFAIILIASEVGCISALFMGPINEHYLKSSKNIIITYMNIGGLSCILFIVPFYTPNLTTFTIIWCSFCRFLTGVSFSFLSAATINFASQNTRHSHSVINENNADAAAATANTISIIAVLHFSWPLSTSLNIGSGYLIQYLSWIFVFIIIGTTLILSSLLVFYMPSLRNQSLLNNNIVGEEQKENEENDDSMIVKRDSPSAHCADEGWEGLKKLMFDWRSLLILFTSFWMTFRSRSIYIVISSFWMESVFNLSASDVGLSNICIVAGEALSPLFVTYYLKRFPLQFSVLWTLITEVVITVGYMLVLAGIYGNTLGSLASVLVLIVLLTFSHQCFYILQQANAIQYAPEKHLSLFLLLGERMFQEFGSIIALLITADLWNEYFEEGAILFSVIWTMSAIAMASVLFIYMGDFQQKL